MHGKEGAMTTSRLSLAALVLAPLVLACAHSPAARSTAAASSAPAPERVLVTGSRLPQRVDPRTGRPVTASPVQVYTRDELLHTGLSASTAAALMKLDPALHP
jgi:hypothetical protein